MAPAHSKYTKQEGKKPMPISKSAAKKVQIQHELIFLHNTNQNPEVPTEKICGWCLTDTKRKNGAVIWCLAKMSGEFPNQTVILTAPSGHGKPAEFPPSTLSGT